MEFLNSSMLLVLTSPKTTNSSEEIFASPNLFIQLFVNAAHKSFGDNYIGTI
jgi:hypothetical protein